MSRKAKVLAYATAVAAIGAYALVLMITDSGIADRWILAVPAAAGFGSAFFIARRSS